MTDMTWPSQPFGDLYAEPSKNGLTRPKRVRGAGVKMVNMGELFAFSRLDGQEMDRVPVSEFEAASFGLRAGDLLFARQSLIASGAGKCSIVLAVPEPTTFESHLIRVRLDPAKADPHYFYYYLSSPDGKGRVQSLVMQVAAAGIRGSELAKLPVPVPPAEVQRRIASILSAYDNLIENNTRRIAILEEMARLLYREWFVNFRFPGHENVEVVESPIGAVPYGWDVVSASAAADISPTTKMPKDGEKPFVPMNGLSNDSMVITNIETRGGSSGAKFKNGDTLFARMTPCLENGKTGYVQFLPSDDDVAFGSTEFIVMRSRTVRPEFVYLMARSDAFRDNAIKSMSGATGRQRVQEACFDRFRLAHPPADLVGRFSELVSPHFRSVHILHAKNLVLRETRDLLLPRLISGELGVSDLDIDTGELSA